MRVRFQIGPAGVAAVAPTPVPVSAVVPNRTARKRSAAARKASKGRGRAGLVHGVITAATLLAVAGCAALDPNFARSWGIEPVQEVKHTLPSGQANYQTGRYYDGLQAWDQAIDAYRRAIDADTRNVEARNALGVALAQRGSLAEAALTLREAIALDPGRAHVHNNLGQVLMLAGQSREAVRALETAVKLQPFNSNALANLRAAMAQVDERPPALAAQPLPAVISVAAPIVLANVPAPGVTMHVIDRPTMASLQSEPTTLHGESSPPSPATAIAEAPASSAHRAAALEVKNGNGVSGMGARVRGWLAQQGLPAERLSNQRPYVQQYTEVQYRSGFEDVAQRVAHALPAVAQVSPVARSDLRTDVRVVLGRDWIPSAACLRSSSCVPPTTMVAAATAQPR